MFDIISMNASVCLFFLFFFFLRELNPILNTNLPVTSCQFINVSPVLLAISTSLAISVVFKKLYKK